MSELNIPESWAESELKNVSDISMGQSPKGTTVKQDMSGTPLVGGAANIKDGLIVTDKSTSSPTKLCKKGDFIYCVRATIGKLGVADKEYCLGRGVAGITSKLYPEYLKYFLINIEKELVKQATGSTFVQIDKKTLESSLVPVPPKDEQQRIAQKIDLCFKKIDSTKSCIVRIEKLFEKLSISFLMDKDDWLPSAFLEEITTERTERVAIKNPPHRKIGVDNKIGVVDLRVTSKNTFEKYKIVKKGDILYNPMRVNVGSIALYLDEDEAITSPDYIVFSTNEGYSSWLIFNYLKSSFGAEEISRKLTGSVRERLYYKKLKDIPFPNPSLEIHKKANKVLNGLNLEISLFQEKMDELLSLTKSSILEKAFQGQLVPQIADEGTGLELLELINNNRKKNKK